MLSVTTLAGGTIIDPHFTDEETEALAQDPRADKGLVGVLLALRHLPSRL